MYKALLAHINSCMGGNASTKQNKITGPGLIGIDGAAPILHGGNSSRREYSRSTLIAVFDKSTAIKPSLRGVAAIIIRRPNK